MKLGKLYLHKMCGLGKAEQVSVLSFFFVSGIFFTRDVKAPKLIV